MAGRKDLNTYEWKQRRAALRKASRAVDAPCAICGLPIDYDAERYDPNGFSADHVVSPLHGGDHTLIRATHVGCNSRRGATRRDIARSRASRRWL